MSAPSTSWVEGAQPGRTDFPLQNLPLGVFAHAPADRGRIGVAIGPQVLDLAEAQRRGLLPDLPDTLAAACGEASLDALLAQGHAAMDLLRAQLTALLHEGAPCQREAADCLVPQAGVQMRLPVSIGDYTDFLASRHHAFNVGSLYRPDAPILPNFRSLPPAYHGRSSSVIPDGEPVWRPEGQSKPHGADAVAFGPSRRLDFEAEFGAIVGAGNPRGRPIRLAEAEAHLAGLVLLNDWSARDLQAWETQPLGPFLGKSFATTISPWMVTMQALRPFRTAAAAREPDDPPLLPYLLDAGDRAVGGIDIRLQTRLSTARMRAQGLPAQVIATARFARDCHWTLAQMVAHHTAGGCNLRTGDLLGSGTVSGPGAQEAGSLLELTRGGKAPIELPGGERRAFLEDGDEITLSAHCEAPGQVRIGFGACRGVVEPARHA
ncbi:MAG: fumarylacetoacetase [Xenophilus sp.]